jgi:orotidine-5'-phosphate decarboxylase
MVENVNILSGKGIILAADVWEKPKLFSLIRDVSPFVEAIKVGSVVLCEHGWRIIEEIKTITERPIIADLKLMDIPYIAEILSKKAYAHGADGLLICGPVGGETIAACKSTFRDKLVFVFTQFTHMTGLISDEMADEYVDLALILGCDGVQVPATLPGRISAVRKQVGEKLLIISCGVGVQGAGIGDAILSGADYEIIGRHIYEPKSKTTSPGVVAMRARERIMTITKNLSVTEKPHRSGPARLTSAMAS